MYFEEVSIPHSFIYFPRSFKPYEFCRGASTVPLPVLIFLIPMHPLFYIVVLKSGDLWGRDRVSYLYV